MNDVFQSRLSVQASILCSLGATLTLGCGGADSRGGDTQDAVGGDTQDAVGGDTQDTVGGDTADGADTSVSDSTVSTDAIDVADTGETTVTGYYPPNDSDIWQQLAPATAGFTTAGLEALKQVVEENHSSSFMMLVGGRIVVEWYFMGADAETRTDVASVQKSVTSTLVGIARDKGILEFDDFVSDHLSAGWSNATPSDEGLITLRHLMTHSSGLSPDTLTRVAAPGTIFDYNTEAYQKLRLVLEAASGLDINTLSRTWLFDAIGVGAEWIDRGSVDSTGAAIWGLRMSARDMARFGLFAERAGAWAGTQVTSADWFAEAWTPSAVKPDYGLLWWLQGRGSLRGKAPLDLASALGARDQKIFVVPSLHTVVIRQGLAAGTESEAESNFDLVLIEAIVDARE